MIMALVYQGASTLGAALAVSGVSIVAVQAARRRPILGSTLSLRWLTWAILAPLWLIAATWGLGRVGLLSLFAVIAVLEFSRLHPAIVRFDRWLLVGLAAVSLPLSALFGVNPIALIALVTVTSLVAPLVSQDVVNGPDRIGAVTVGYVLMVLPFILLDGFATQISGAAFFTVGFAVALSDVTAFVVGSTMGKRRVAAALSPNKTVAGVVGSVIGAAAGTALAIVVGIVDSGLWWLAPVVAVGAVAGDLTVSLLKRHRGVKDAASWLPGFGGLLDRVDSLLVVAFLVFVVVAVTGGA